MAGEFQEIKVGNEILRFPITMSDDEIALAIEGDVDIQAQLSGDAVEYEDNLFLGMNKRGLTATFSFVEAIAENPIWGNVYKDVKSSLGLDSNYPLPGE